MILFVIGSIGGKLTAGLSREVGFGVGVIDLAHCVDIVALAPHLMGSPTATESRDIVAPHIPSTLDAEFERGHVSELAVQSIERHPFPSSECVRTGAPKRFDAPPERGLRVAADTGIGGILRAHVQDEHVGAVA